MSIAQNFPTISPSLSLDFANVEALDPRITFARASTATYYGTQTAKAEQNLLLRSQDYSATWTVTSLTPVTAKTAPDGTATATEFTASAANAVLTQGYTAIAGSYTFSVYLRRVTGTGDIQIAADNGTWNTKVITASWARYDITQTVTAGAKTAGIRVVDSSDAIEVWGAQLEQRSAVTAYTVTTTQPITNYIPVLETAASGVARFDHNPTTTESLGLLIEEQRTNLLTYSEQFDNAVWNKYNATINSNTLIAPDGTLSADTMVENSGSVTPVTFFGTGISFTSGTAYTASVYVKANGRNIVSLLYQPYNFTSLGRTAWFDLSNQTTQFQSGVTGTITDVGDGWYRCTITATSNFTSNVANNSLTIQLVSALGSTSAYTGNGYSGVFIWGAQLEVGAFATSYIPTVASQVTRAADAASMTGTNFTSWFNNAEGTLYAEGVSASGGSGNQMIASIGDGAAAQNQVTMYKSGAALLQLITSSGATQSSLNSGLVATSNTNYKFSTAYKVNDFAFSVNANTVATDTSGQVPAVVNKLDIGNWHVNATGTWNSTIKKISYYPLRLTNSQLQALTS